MCGEQAGQGQQPLVIEGSPPRVRGTACLIVLSCSSGRITPACAGNRCPASHPPNMIEDHPRVCGEQQGVRLEGGLVLGSPPRVRGTDSISCIKKYGRRITPACAGNSPYQMRQAILHGDHPRVCGEQMFWTHHHRYCLGSPPRVRGTEVDKRYRAKITGITPACAGNSFPP